MEPKPVTPNATRGATRFSGLPASNGKQDKSPAEIQKRREERKQTIKTTRVATGIGLLGAFGLGYAFKDGINRGCQKIASISNAISNIIAIPVTFLFPSILLKKEYNFLRNGAKGGEENTALVFYPLLSLAFAPRTWGEPLQEATRSLGHMVATAFNMPNMLFCLFSYTGGRLMSLIKVLEMNFKSSSHEQLYRLEQERKAFQRAGNLGSNHCSSIPLASQCATGWQNIIDLFKGNFSSIKERFKHEPVSAFLGTFVSSWSFIPDYLSKCLDSMVRTAEMSPHFKYAFGENSWVTSLVTRLEKFKNWYHETAQNKNSSLGNLLQVGRGLSKAEAVVLAPFGMLGIVTTMFDRYFRGEFLNKEAQELGGTVASIDKLFSTGAFLSHLYYTTAYTLTTRLPQTITTATFYITNLINKLRGVDLSKTGKEYYQKNPSYTDPNKVRDWIFNRPFIRKISNWAARKINDIEQKIHPDNPSLITEDENGNLTKNCSMVGYYDLAIANNECYIPIREELYDKEVKDEYPDDGLRSGYKSKHEKPSAKKWAQVLRRNKENILSQSKARITRYLREVELFDDNDINYFITNRFPSIKKTLDNAIGKEIKTCEAPESIPTTRKLVEKSKSFAELLLHPKELLEVLKLRTFHNFFTILPLSILNFVNVFDFGKVGEPLKIRKHVLEYCGINIGDFDIACNQELTPVYNRSLGAVGKAIATVVNLFRGNFHTALFGSGELS